MKLIATDESLKVLVMSSALSKFVFYVLCNNVSLFSVPSVR
jgi:hypothetical protein